MSVAIEKKFEDLDARLVGTEGRRRKLRLCTVQMGGQTRNTMIHQALLQELWPRSNRARAASRDHQFCGANVPYKIGVTIAAWILLSTRGSPSVTLPRIRWMSGGFASGQTDRDADSRKGGNWCAACWATRRLRGVSHALFEPSPTTCSAMQGHAVTAKVSSCGGS